MAQNCGLLVWQSGSLFWQSGLLFWQSGSLFWQSGSLVWQSGCDVMNFVSFITLFLFVDVTTSDVVTTRSILVPPFSCLVTECRALATPRALSACDFVRAKPRGRSQ